MTVDLAIIVKPLRFMGMRESTTATSTESTAATPCSACGLLAADAPRAVHPQPWLLPSAVAMLGVLAIVTVYQIIFHEVIPYRNGFGFDPFFLRPIFYDFPAQFFGHKIEAYLIQRTFMPFVVHYGMRLFHIPFNDCNIVCFGECYQTVVRFALLLVWLRICKVLQLKKAGIWLGFTAMFINFAVLKASLYYPLLSDMTALLFSALMFCCYLENRLSVLVCAACLSLTVWPTTIVFALLLILFPRQMEVRTQARENRIILMILASISGLFMVKCYFTYQNWAPDPFLKTPPVMWLLPISVTLASLYLFTSLRVLTSHVDTSFRYLLALLSAIPRRLLAAAVVLLLYVVLTKRLSMSPAPYAAILTVQAYFFHATARPLQFLVGHAMYYGPLLITLYIMFGRIAHRCRGLGLGAFLCMVVTLLLSVNSESRQLVNTLPFVVVPLVLVLDDTPKPRYFVPLVFAVSILMSRFWLPINLLCTPESAAVYPCVGDLQSMPAQLFFMNFTPWTSNTSLLCFAVVCLAALPIVGLPFARSESIANRSSQS